MPVLPEFAREYFEKGNNVRTNEDILQLAKKQISNENHIAFLGGQHGLICDTDILVLYVWCHERFPPVPSALEAIVKHHRYDFTLLCSPDLPWVHDSLRENPNDRDRLFLKYKSMLDQIHVPYGIIKGQGQKRFELAKKLLNSVLK